MVFTLRHAFCNPIPCNYVNRKARNLFLPEEQFACGKRNFGCNPCGLRAVHHAVTRLTCGRSQRSVRTRDGIPPLESGHSAPDREPEVRRISVGNQAT